MDRKIIISVLCVFILTLGAVPALGLELPKEFKEIEKNVNSVETNELDIENDTIFITKGPAKRISEINFISGNETEIEKIENLLNKKFYQPVFRPFVFVNNLTFTINYTRIPLLFLKNMYITQYSPIKDVFEGNFTNFTSYIDEPHSVLVKNFSGIFKYDRASIFKPLRFRLFWPAELLFRGYCEKVIDLSIETSII